MIDAVRTILRSQVWWLQLRELQREGVAAACRRLATQRAIDRTPPIVTDRSGPAEVRVLTWRRDWRNAVWALKSFYAYSGVRYPLYLHDGGWLEWQELELRRHFPTAIFVGKAESDRVVESWLEEREYERSLAYRRKNGVTRKLFDFFLMSQAEYVITLDSDLLFFRSPRELLQPSIREARNLYARDSAYFYSMTLDELEDAIGIRPKPYFNPGPSLASRRSIDFALIERSLQQPKMFDDKWVTEQTLHALCGSAHGADYFPDSYVIDPRPGRLDEVICKHYPGRYRDRLYTEGMPQLLQQGFIERLHALAAH